PLPQRRKCALLVNRPERAFRWRNYVGETTGGLSAHISPASASQRPNGRPTKRIVGVLVCAVEAAISSVSSDRSKPTQLGSSLGRQTHRPGRHFRQQLRSRERTDGTAEEIA